jgi:hypothetical protein
MIKSKGLRVYREEIGEKTGPMLDTLWQRAIVTSNMFSSELPVGRILSIGRQSVPVVTGKEAILSLGRVAGFDKLAFGMPSKTSALLWLEGSETMVSCAELSAFSTARFAPAKAWRPVM